VINHELVNYLLISNACSWSNYYMFSKIGRYVTVTALTTAALQDARKIAPHN